MSHVVPGGGGTIYAVNDAGQLLWFRDANNNGTMNWAPGSGNVIGNGWQGMRHVVSGGGGVLYAVTDTGELRWYRDLRNDGQPGWAQGSGNRIGVGWHAMRHVASGGGGTLYGVNEAGDLLWFRDAGNNGTVSWAPGTGNRIGTGWAYLRWVAPLSALGHGSYKVQGRSARGARRLLVVLVEYTGTPASNFPTFPRAVGAPHSPSYYYAQAFGAPAPPFFTSQPDQSGGTATNPASLNGYVQENSHGRFNWVPVGQGVVGPISMGALADLPGDPGSRTSLILQRVSTLGLVQLTPHDLNHDGAVSFDELCVLVVENIAGAWPANRACNAFTATEQIDLPGPFDVTLTKTVQVSVAGVGPLTPFYQIAHETLHSLGLSAASDLRGYGQQNNLLTVMSGYSFTSDDQRSVHLDGFHKHVLGWVDSRIHRLTTPGEATVISHAARADASVILWDPDKGTENYFVLEYRGPTPAVGLAYDEAVAGSEPGAPQAGLAIWRVPGVLSGTRVTEHLGAPDLQPAGAALWTSGQLTPPLTWADGSATGVRLRVGALDPHGGTVHISWCNRRFPLSIYGIHSDGQLLWYRHNGYLIGGQVETWEPQDTGHKVVGHGFQDVRLVFSAGRGVIYTISHDAILRWYKHNGYRTGGGVETWEPQDTGHKVVGHGFQDVRIAFGGGSGVLYTISQDGILRWYRHKGYLTGGGLETWEPQDTGYKRVGQGFQHVRLAFSAGKGVIYTISDDGILRWYRHNGYLTGGGVETWEPQDTGHKVVGHGFGSVRLAFYGGSGVIYTVSEDGVLRWYKHNGYLTGGGVETWEPQDTGHRVVGHGWQAIRLAFAMT
jgi:M6 family metalloprotease-like protein